MVEKRHDGLLVVKAEPLEVAELLCGRMVEALGIVDGALLREADSLRRK